VKLMLIWKKKAKTAKRTKRRKGLLLPKGGRIFLSAFYSLYCTKDITWKAIGQNCLSVYKGS
jgi:hypothetical protein